MMYALMAAFFLLSSVVATIQGQSGGVLVSMLLVSLMAILASQEPRKPLPKIRYRSGYVYVIRSLTNQSLYKIGRTNDPNRRTRMFNVKFPFEIEIVCMIQTDDMYKLETQLHGKFSANRVNGEWFNLSASDLIYLENFPGNTLKSRAA